MLDSKENLKQVVKRPVNRALAQLPQADTPKTTRATTSCIHFS
jgi:hypothetical protein